MSTVGVASAILLAAGLVIVVASCIGMAVMDDPLDRLHLVTPAATLGVVGVCAAIVVRAGLSAAGLSAILVAVFVAGTSPFIGHAVARAILARDAVGPESGGAGEASGGGDT